MVESPKHIIKWKKSQKNVHIFQELEKLMYSEQDELLEW